MKSSGGGSLNACSAPRAVLLGLDTILHRLAGFGIFMRNFGESGASRIFLAELAQRHAEPQQALGRFRGRGIIVIDFQKALRRRFILFALILRFAEPICRVGGITVAGIPPEEIDSLFQPFHGSFARGSGLGLAIVHRIVSDYQGRIQVHSTPGAGTTVAVCLPVRAEVTT